MNLQYAVTMALASAVLLPAEALAHAPPFLAGAAPEQASFAVAATPAYARQVINGSLPRAAPEGPAAAPPPGLGASFSYTAPAADPAAVPRAAPVSPVPEPSTALMMLAGLAAVLVVLGRRARRDG